MNSDKRAHVGQGGRYTESLPVQLGRLLLADASTFYLTPACRGSAWSCGIRGHKFQARKPILIRNRCMVRETAMFSGTRIVVAALFIPFVIVMIFLLFATSGGSPLSRSDAIDPVIDGGEVAHFAENHVGLVATYTTHTSDISWSASGLDGEHFVIDDNGNLRFRTPPNFEKPDDANGDNVYEVAIVAQTTGLRLHHSGSLEVLVHVTDIED